MDHSAHQQQKKMDHSNHHLMMVKDFRKRFVVTALITIPILILSPTVQSWLGLELPDFVGQDILLFLLASVVAIYGAKPFYVGALK